uniref:Peptidase S1 domain-containing protein n=2 Tax=Anopheles gambiae TaxID=7165 RepID=A0A1S4H4I7_ANOGA
MKQVFCLVILGLFCSNSVSANKNENATAEEAVVVNGKNVTKAEAAARSGRITNSVAVDIAKYTFAQSLRLDGRYRCGAVVISTSHALTGAAAVYSFSNSVQRLTLYGGSTSPTSGGVSFQVIRIAVHPNYNPNGGVSDFNIAVLTVPTNAFGGKRNIVPIPLASAGVSIGTKCSVFGWGSTNLNLLAPVNALRAAGMVITSEATCARVWAQLGVKITSNILCAKGDRAADLCNGDLGNGLVCNGKLTGVAFLFSRCDSVFDTGYMKITAPSVRSFIRSQTGI